MIRTLVALGATAVLAASTMTAAPASARLLGNDHFAETGSHIEQEERGDEFCPNVEFPVLFTGDFTAHDMVRTKGSSPCPYFSVNFRSDDTYTNLDNDKSLRLLSVFNGSATRITDNGDGTITVEFADKARQHVFGPDGERLFVDTGQFRARALIDYNGTPENPDDDVELDFEVLKDTGRNDTSDRDFCEVLVTFLG